MKNEQNISLNLAYTTIALFTIEIRMKQYSDFKFC